MPDGKPPNVFANLEIFKNNPTHVEVWWQLQPHTYIYTHTLFFFNDISATLNTFMPDLGAGPL